MHYLRLIKTECFTQIVATFIEFRTFFQNHRKLFANAVYNEWSLYRAADKYLARPGRKQATATEDFEFHISYL